MLIIYTFVLLTFFSIFRDKKSEISKGLLFLVILALICSAGFRTDGLDFENYKFGYEYNSFKEPVFKALVTILKHFFASSQAFFLVVALFTVLLTYNYIIKVSGDLYWLSLLVFVSNYYLEHDYIQIRIGLACAIFLYQLYNLNLGKRKKAFLLWVIASCCHFSLLVGIVSFFISNKKITNKECYFVFGSFFLIFFLALKGISVVSIAAYIPGVNYYYRLYMNLINNGTYTSIKIINPIYLSRYCLFLLCLLKRHVLYKYNNNIYFYLRLYFLGILSFLLLTGIPVFAFRISEIFFISELLIFPIIRNLFKNKTTGNIFVIFVAIYYFIINVFHNHFIIF